jgi:hypothetical protein
MSIVMKSVSFKLLEPSGPVQTSNGMAQFIPLAFGHSGLEQLHSAAAGSTSIYGTDTGLYVAVLASCGLCSPRVKMGWVISHTINVITFPDIIFRIHYESKRTKRSNNYIHYPNVSMAANILCCGRLGYTTNLIWEVGGTYPPPRNIRSTSSGCLDFP